MCNVTFDIFFKHIVNDWINVLVTILHKHREAVFDSHFELFQKVRVIEGYYFEIVLFLLFLDPFECLLLRIDAVSESTRLYGQYTVLNRKLIRRQALTAPSMTQIKQTFNTSFESHWQSTFNKY